MINSLTLNNEIDTIIDEFENIIIKNNLKLFRNHHIKLRNKEYALIINKFLNSLPLTLEPKDITWDWFQALYDYGKEKKEKEIICILITKLISSNCYSGCYKDIVSSFLEDRNILLNLPWLFDKKYTPLNLIIAKMPPFNKNLYKTYSIIAFKTDINNLYLYKLLSEFIKTNPQTSKSNRQFFAHFQASLGNNTVNCIEDFNKSIFDTQYWYYKNNAGKNNRHISLLKSLYLFLMNTPLGANILKWQDGIDFYMLQSVSFNENYEQGYKLVPLNPLDPIPNHDLWLVMPNGIEKKGNIIKSHNYKPINFSDVDDIKIKFAIKSFFWNDTITLTRRITNCNTVLFFARFICNLRNLDTMSISNEDDSSFSNEEIFSYVSYVKLNNLNYEYIPLVKKFLIFSNENNLLKTPPEALQYLVGEKKDPIKSPQDIPENELILIENEFKQNSSQDIKAQLYYIVFHIALSTEIRVSQIISLKIDCIYPDIKNKYYLVSNTKVTNGKKIKVPITEYTKRFIETAINITNPIRDTCLDDKLKQYIFLHDHYANKFSSLEPAVFRDTLKRICKKLNIPKYTPENIRNTYMTKAFEFAMKNNLSEIELKSLTWHKRYDTTNNHYVSKRIKDYLEATHKITIGNVTPNGVIIPEKNDKTTKENLVNNKCGYCSKESCTVINALDCLMCSGFIATIDRIPFFKKSISELDNKIQKAELLHDKEHLSTIKSLYVLYLGCLLTLKEEKNNEQSN